MDNIENVIGELNHIVKMYNIAKCRQFPIQQAIKSLEKQIPKQIVGIEANLQNRYCPSCNEWMIFEKVGKVKHCPMCGQSLKWDDVK